jgi:heat shock protein HslJ
MIAMFGPAQNYGFEEDGNVLIFAWAAGGPIDYFRNANAPAAVDANLVGKTWQWNGLTSSVLDVTVKTPANYLITFNEDGSASIQADCNLVQGSYTAVSSSLNIEMGPSTLALCPDGSLADLYLLGLGTTTGYTIQNDTLALNVGQNDGVMLFSEAGTEATVPDPDEEVDLPDPETGEATGTVTAPDGIYLRSGPGTEYPPVGTVAFGETGTIIGVSEDGQWWVVEAPNQADGQAWVSASFIDAANAGSVPVVETPELLPTLTDNPWQWLSLTTPVESTTVGDPNLYTITFNADGTASIKADCNNAAASYTTDGNAINIDTGATTLVACPEGSLDALYLNSLINVSSYFFDAGSLYLEMPADGGTMKFAPTTAPAPPEEPETPPEETDAQLFQVTSFGPAGAEQAVLEGTQITATFTDTEVKGNAGCNEYTGVLNRTDDAFTIGAIVLTEKACSEPAGIMEQEQAYLAALQNVAGFSWEEKLADDGSKIVTIGQLFYTLDSVNGIINLITP